MGFEAAIFDFVERNPRFGNVESDEVALLIKMSGISEAP